MIAKETYKLLRSVAGPWFKENGFALIKSSYLTYRKPVNDKFFTVRFQCHHRGWEKYKGSSFTVWLQHTSEADINHMISSRLTSSMNLPELELVRARQNRVLGAIPPPPPEYINEMVSGFTKSFREPQQYIDIFLSDWKTANRPFSPNDDIWFRYFSEADVRSWAIFLLNHIQSRYVRATRDV